MKNKMYSFTIIVLSICIATPAAIACWKSVAETRPLNLEMGGQSGCSGNCLAFNSCPLGTECKRFQRSGFTSCTDGLVTVPANRVHDGTSAGTGACCHGGTVVGIAPAGATCSQPTATIGIIICKWWIV